MVQFKHKKNNRTTFFSLCLFLICLLWINTGYAQKILHVEPPHWWVGLQEERLQLMIHGENIAQYRPTIDYADLAVQEIISVENPNYLFINLLLTEKTLPGIMHIQFKDARGKKVKFQYDYVLKERKKDAFGVEGYTPEDVIYLITPDRFANGNTQNDTIAGLKEKSNRDIPGGRHGGDLAGISQHLDYIADMGFTAICLNPVLENDMPSHSYHGYATTDFYKIDPRYGSLAEYKSLIKKAQNQGTKVIMDMTVNHCGSEHWWMKDLPSKDWINNQGKFTPTNHKKAVIQDPYASQKDYKDFTDGWFVESMPDLNQNNPLMATYLIQNTIWWIEETGLNGIRMDTYSYPDKNFMTRWTCSILTEYPDFGIIGEEWNNDPAIVSFWQMGKANSNGYISCLPSLMDFPLQENLSKTLQKEGDFDMLYEIIAKDFFYPRPDMLVIFPDNHDMDRFYTQVGENMDYFKMGLAIIATMRGIPQLYYGTEMLIKNPNTHDHGVLRADFPGGWANDSVNGFTGQNISPQQKETQLFIKKLLNWRKNKEVIHYGNMMHFVPQKNVYVYFRYNLKEMVMVVLNKNNEVSKISTKDYNEILPPNAKGIDALTGQSINLSSTLEIPKNGFFIIEIKP